VSNSKAKRTQTIIVDKNGLQGTLAHEGALSTDDTRQVLVHFQNGQKVLMAKELLTQGEDGRYYLETNIEELAADQEGRWGDTLVIPVIKESATVQTHTVEKGRVEIRKRVHEHMEVVDPPLQSEEVEVERVTINRVVEETPPIRREGDTMIIPLLEEVLVVEKRLVLREEVRVRKVSKEVHTPQEVLLRNEQVEIERKATPNLRDRQGEREAR